MTPDVTPLAVIGVNATPRIEHVTFLVFRNSLVLALHSLSCLAGYLARSEMPAEAARYRGWIRALHDRAGHARHRVRQRRDALLARHPGARARARRIVDLRAARDQPRRCCCSPCCPTRSPSSTAVFLPLAAWILLSRQGRWDEMLAATLVTTALAFPVIVLAAVVETYVSPHLLVALLPG